MKTKSVVISGFASAASPQTSTAMTRQVIAQFSKTENLFNESSLGLGKNWLNLNEAQRGK